MEKALINLTGGIDDPERVTVALLVASRSAVLGKDTVLFLTGEAVRLAVPGFGADVAYDGCPPLAELLERFETARGRYFACPYGIDGRGIDRGALKPCAEVGGMTKIWEWAGDDHVLSLSY
jgi:predicted peroxiredoxin